MIIRKCPLCNSSDYAVLFSFTYEYLTKIQGVDKDLLDFIGFYEDSKSSIVTCKDCEFIFIREHYEFDKKFEKFWDIKPRKSDNSKFGEKKNFENRRLGNLIYNSIINQLIMYVNPPSDNPMGKQKWLDYGCGDGHLALMANGINFVDIIGFDINNKKLTEANKKGLNISSSISDINSNGPYDCIICTSVVEHVENPLEIITSLSKNLKSNGILYLTLPVDSKKNIISHCNDLSKDRLNSTYHLGHINYFTTNQLRSILVKNGLRPYPAFSIWGGFKSEGFKIKLKYFKIGVINPIAKKLVGNKYNLRFLIKT
tara:strand:+ start:34168 stop:35106 length:939 start_codon:yes stop_codon:yes gene_type:complete